MARLWAGVHWRSDHVAGQQLGRNVAGLMIEQLRLGGIEFLPPIADCQQSPPPPAQIQSDANAFEVRCGDPMPTHDPGPRCD